MTDPILRVDLDDGIATLTLNRPEKRNALNGPLVTALREAFAEAADDEDVRVVLLTGAGKDFCSGADLAEMERIADMSADENLSDALHLGGLFEEMRACPKPVVAAVRGKAFAGGCGLATACDLVLAHEDAEFGYPEVHLGFVPAMVMAILRRKVTESRAFELVSLGRPVDAAEARRVGLVNQVFGDTTFHADVAGYVAELAKKPPSALKLTKELLYALDDLTFHQGIAEGARVNVVARMTDACREGVRRFLSRHRRG